MAIPVTYNLRSAKERWSSSVVAVLGIAGTVGVVVAMLALARGFQATVSRRASQNASSSARRRQRDDERDDENDCGRGDAPGRPGAIGPLVSPEVVVIAAPARGRTPTPTSVRGAARVSRSPTGEDGRGAP
jgi:putative ABC transport system permease protein